MTFFSPTAKVIEPSRRINTVESILAQGHDLFELIESKALAFLLCGNNYETIYFYINAIEKRISTVLLDGNIDKQLLHNLIDKYKPEIIFLPESKDIELVAYNCLQKYEGYALYSQIIRIPSKINPNLALLLTTSGTTGSSRMVKISYNNLEQNAQSIVEYLKLNNSEVAITILPFNYSYGLSVINSHLMAGATIVLNEYSITQRQFWDNFKHYSITSFSGVPYTYEMLKRLKFNKMDLPALKTITQAGGKLPEELAIYLLEYSKEKRINFFIMYGQTEGTARLSYVPPDRCEEKMGSIGIAIPGGFLYLIDETGSTIKECGVNGEIIYQGPNVMMGYSEQRMDLEIGDELKGILKTGDIAFKDEDGYFYIVGRKKRFIKIYGNRVNLDEIEKSLFVFGIEAVCTGNDNNLCVHVLNENQIEIVKIYLLKKLRMNIQSFNIQWIKEFPRSESGKILYSKL
jgi:long-chain acyl-CoA synthetase